MPESRRPAWSRGASLDDIGAVLGLGSLADLSPEWAWGGATGAGVRVALIDSGVDAGHPALEGCVDADAGVALRLAPDGAVVAEPGPHEDLFGHGTACAEIIHRFVPEARITSVRVLDARLGGRSAVFLHGLAWAAERGFDVINLSLGTGTRDWALAFYEVCDEAYFRNCVVVTAANNQARASYPSLYASVLSVACNAAADPWRFHVNPEPPTEFLARGVNVDVAWRGGGRRVVTGNSFAAPHIAGLAALVRSKHRGLRPFQVKTVLWATAHNVRAAEAQAARDAPVPPARGGTAVFSLADLMERYPELAAQPAPEAPR
ncbi:MAG TPA: S8 family serine peptidase [Solirubrobacteraceae bacterium]|jgi:subtilisin family serine protease